MTQKTRQLILVSIAALFAIVLALFLANRNVANDRTPPPEVAAKAAWIADHPADWLTAAAISDAALDTSLPRRRELWVASYALARHLAPRLRNPPAAFVRDGLFHWYELSDADRKAVLDAAVPLLRDPQLFGDLQGPLFALTRDFDYLFRNAPQTLDALGWLRSTASMRGLFDDYRRTRAAIERLRLASSSTDRPLHEWPSLFPRTITTAEEPLVRSLLQQMQQQSFEPGQFGPSIEPVIEYAIAHHLQPLDGLVPFVEGTEGLPDFTRARLALALGRPEAASLIELASPNMGSPEWARYHIERALFEARQGNAALADVQLRRAVVNRLDPSVLAAAEQSATLLHKDAAAAQYRQQLAATARQPRYWDGTCGTNELCGSARTVVYSPGSIDIHAEVVQSDQTPPYLEIYADDARVAEGEVASERVFKLPLPRGAHRIEVRLVNPEVANGTQRRVRLS